MTSRPILALGVGVAAGFLAGVVVGGRLGNRAWRATLAAASYRARTDAELGAAEATIGKLSAELHRERQEYAALSVRADELIGRIRDLEQVNAELRTSIDTAFEAGAAFEREHRLGPTGEVRPRTEHIDVEPEPGWAPRWLN